MSLAEAAKELLELEERYRKGALNHSEIQRWADLASEVFADTVAGGRRRSFRLPAKVSARARIRGEEHPCEVCEVSHLGLTLAGASLPDLPLGEVLQVVSVAFDDKREELELSGAVARQESAAGGRTLAINFSTKQPEARERYYDAVYYPLYLGYLKSLAAG